jgi:hypothetical protein
MVRTCLSFVLVVVAFGCASSGVMPSHNGDLAVRGWESGSWKSEEGAPPPDSKAVDFEFSYETTAYRGRHTKPFHRMKTEIRLSYDPEEGRIEDATVRSSEDGYAYRHVCCTPNGPVLRIRIITNLDDRSEDLTVVRLQGPMPSLEECADIGVGPWKGLVETVDVLFHEDGTYTVMKGTGAHLTEAGIRVERTMSTAPGAASPETTHFPQ